jgi:hypothetical protein
MGENSKTDLKEVRHESVTAFSWLRTGADCEHCNKF